MISPRRILMYALALVGVASAVALTLAAELVGFRKLEVPLILFVLAAAVWYGGFGPGIVAIAAGIASIAYLFTEPRFSFYIDRADVGYFVVFVLFAALIGWFALRRRRIEQELRNARDELEARHANLLDVTHDAIFVRGFDGGITYWNRGAQELFGWTPVQAVGRNANELMLTVFPRPIEDILDELLRTGRWEGELGKTRADGRELVVASRWSLQRDRHQQAAAILETNNDITERKAAEARIRKLNADLELRTHELEASNDELAAEVAMRLRYANLLELANDAIFVRAWDGTITYWNRGAQELLGWTPEQACSQKAQELLHTVFPASRDEVQQELLCVGRWEGELIQTAANGRQVIFATRWSLQCDAAGQPSAVLEANDDITERKRAEERIQKLNLDVERRTLELEASNKELEAFAYSVSHDLRAPLRHVAAYSELLQKQAASVLDERCKRYVENLVDSAKKMGMLIDDLLAFSRIGRAETRTTLVSLADLAREVVRDMERETDGRDVEWRIGELPEVHGDRSMLRLALANLLANALKFTRPRAQTRIEIGSRETPSGEFVVSVRDNGVGFDMRYVDKLFGVFQRLHSGETFEGTGIGLATVQRIVTRHGGRAWAEGAVDAGATFYFSLPKP